MTEVPIMVMPWHRPDPCKPLKMQTDAAFKSTYLDYLATLRLDSAPLAIPLTTIAATIGPASNNVETLVDLMQQGMSIALVPLALGTRKEHMDTIAKIRSANSAFSNMRNMLYPLGIAVQTKGPGIRLGGLVKDVPITLNLHHKITLTTDKAWRTKGTEHYIYINFPEMCHMLAENDILLVNSGAVILQVEFIAEPEVKCVVVGNGVIQSFTSVMVPDVPLNLPPLTDEDVDDLQLAVEMGVDIVVLSQTQSADLVKDVRKILGDTETGSGIKLWAQVESNVALKNLECILEVADAVVFSRISLLQDVPAEKLFLAQKIVVSTCNKAGVPVFISSHFLPSMQVTTVPSIAEVYDVDSAVLDGVDGFLMRSTVSHGKHPDLAIKTLADVCIEAEAAVWHHQTFSYLNSHAKPPIDPTHSIAIAAVEASLKAAASVILLATTSGRSAQLVARYRPRCPIIAITRYGQVARQLNSWRAIIPLHYVDPPLPEWTRELDVRFQYAVEFAKHKGIVCPGDVMVLLNGWRQGAGFTNTIRVVYASESFPWVYPHNLPDTIPLDEDIIEQEEVQSKDSVKAETAVGEPGATESRSTSTQENKSQRNLSLESAIRSMEEGFKKIASEKAKEMSLLGSIHTIKSNQSTDRTPLKRSLLTNMDNEHQSLHATTQIMASQKTATRTNTELRTPTRLSNQTGTVITQRTASRTKTDLPTSSRLSNQSQRTSTETNIEITTSTRLPDQSETEVSQKTKTRTNTELPTSTISESRRNTVVESSSDNPPQE